jgi:hypothetical protein
MGFGICHGLPRTSGSRAFGVAIVVNKQPFDVVLDNTQRILIGPTITNTGYSRAFSVALNHYVIGEGTRRKKNG